MADLDDPFLALIDARLRELEAAKSVEPRWFDLGVIEFGVDVDAERARRIAAARANKPYWSFRGEWPPGGGMLERDKGILRIIIEPPAVDSEEERRLADLRSSTGMSAGGDPGFVPQDRPQRARRTFADGRQATRDEVMRESERRDRDPLIAGHLGPDSI
jgi:hypothetical protein